MKIKQNVFTRYDLRHTKVGDATIATSSMKRQIAAQILDNAVQEANDIRRRIVQLTSRLQELPEIIRDANVILTGYHGFMKDEELNALINEINTGEE